MDLYFIMVSSFNLFFNFIHLSLAKEDVSVSPFLGLSDGRNRDRRWTNLRQDSNQTQDLISPSKVFCSNGGSPVSLGGLAALQNRKGDSGGQDSSTFNPKNQTLRFNKRYTKIRDLLFYENDGEKLTFQFSEEEDTSDATVRGEDWDDEYIFAKGQFQWCLDFLEKAGGAGHGVNGKVYPVEMELIHFRRSDGTLAKAWAKGGVLIISVLMELVPSGVPALTPLLSNIPYVAQPGPLKLLHAPVNFRQLLPSGDGFFTYSGSYTFSPCHQNVQRLVFETPIEIDIDQMRFFQFLLYEDKSRMRNNFGVLQPLNGRKVTYFRRGFTISTREILLKEEKTSHHHGELKRKQFVGSGQ